METELENKILQCTDSSSLFHSSSKRYFTIDESVLLEMQQCET